MPTDVGADKRMDGGRIEAFLDCGAKAQAGADQAATIRSKRTIMARCIGRNDIVVEGIEGYN